MCNLLELLRQLLEHFARKLVGRLLRALQDEPAAGLGAAGFQELLPGLAIGRVVRLGGFPFVAALLHNAHFRVRGAARQAQSRRDEKG